MDRRPSFKQRRDTQFKKKGAGKKGKWNNFGQEHMDSVKDSGPPDTVYRILCPSEKIGGVIGKGGSIIKTLREETNSKITVSNSVPGSDERVIVIFSPPNKIFEEDSSGEKKDDDMQPHCPAQDALMKVHERIIEEDMFGGVADNEDDGTVVTARLLVPNNMVGCVLGKGGEIIQRLRSETGASIRVLPPDQLPACAMSTDEVVQIQGKPPIVKRALYEVSTRLHQNPRKDKPSGYPMPFGGPGFHARGPSMPNLPPPSNPMWSHRNPPPHMPPPPWMGGGFMPGGFNDGPPGHGGEPSGEFSMKLLCPAGKIGGVIGKGGSNVRQVQQETGASVHVEDATGEAEERVVRVSAFESLWNPRSRTIDAVLLLQNQTSELSEKGIITTRILVPSSKVGCILGQGGSVINEMRRRTQAEIRIFPKEERPNCAAEDEELVQVSGSFAVAKDALAEIASRLRTRCLRSANAANDPGPPGPVPPGPVPPGPVPPGPVQGYGLMDSFSHGGPPLSGSVGVGSSGAYDTVKHGAYDYPPPSYPVPPSGPSPLESKFVNNTVGSVPRPGGNFFANTVEAATGARGNFQDLQVGGAEMQVASQAYMTPGVQPTVQQPSYPTPIPQGSYPNPSPSQQGSYSNPTQQVSYSNPSQQSSYKEPSAQGSHPGMTWQPIPYQSPY